MRIWSSQQYQTFHIESAFDNYKCTTLEIFYNYIHGKYIWNSSVVMNFVCGLRCCNGRDWGKVLPCLQLDYSNSIRVGFRIVGPGSPSEFPTSRLNQKSKRNRQCHVDRHQRIGLPWERTVLIGLNWSIGELCVVERPATAGALCIEAHLTLHSFCSVVLFFRRVEDGIKTLGRQESRMMHGSGGQLLLQECHDQPFFVAGCDRFPRSRR